MTLPLTSDSEDDFMTDSSENSNDACNDAIGCLELAPSPHPFAASTKADRTLPLYEKKSATPSLTPKESRPVITPVCSHGERSSESVRGGRRPNLPLISEERERWAATIAAAVDKAETTLDLRCAYISTNASYQSCLRVEAGKTSHTLHPQ